MTKNTYKFLCIASILFFITFSVPVKAQYQYSIDIGKQKQRRVSVKFFLGKVTTDFSEARKWRKNKRIEERDSKKIKKHAYKIQSREVKKRMKYSRKRAEWHNANKLPCKIKLKTWLNG